MCVDSYYISIIIPIYNKEKYLRTTLDSVVKQTIFDKIQVICVDDNSTDGTMDILKEYKQKYSNNFVIIHSNYNGRYLTNLKRSLPFIKGKYSIILEADDWVDETVYQELYDEIEKIQYDTVETNHVINHYDNRIELDHRYNEIVMDVSDISNNVDALTWQHNYRDWTKLVKSDIFIKALSLFTKENINVITDDVFISISILYYSHSYKIFKTKGMIHYNAKDDTQHNSRTNWVENNDKTKYYRIDNILNTLDKKAYNLFFLLYGSQMFKQICPYDTELLKYNPYDEFTKGDQQK